MAVLTVLYPAHDGAKFDHAYYDAVHIPLVKEVFGPTGLESVQVLRGLTAGDGGAAPYVVIANLIFRDAEALRASRSGPRGLEVRADLARFTDIQPITQISALA
ncbi:EthD family reductase [Caulobacter sp. 1776]|uniref:EthD family reductase n=1 Tax=Caulobacter sp. 1776 TaxID=3156420 RepID=UPI003397E170